MYLHRILSLPEHDPVYLMFENLMALHECGEKNWCSDISDLIERYDLRMGIDKIRTLSKETFKGIEECKR